ncbi:MAG: hypothetical protein ACOYWZ_20195 [Bacillota bacterium]
MDYKTGLLLKGITSGIGDIVGAFTDIERLKLAKEQQVMEQELFGLRKHEAEINLTRLKDDYTPVTLDEIKSGINWDNLGPRQRQLFSDWINPSLMTNENGVQFIYRKRGREFREKFATDADLQLRVLIAKQADASEKIAQLKEMKENPENQKRLPDINAQLQAAIKEEADATRELEFNSNYQTRKRLITEQEKSETEKISIQKIARVASESGMTPWQVSAIANAPTSDDARQLFTTFQGDIGQKPPADLNAIAEAEYNKSWDQLTQSEKKKVRAIDLAEREKLKLTVPPAYIVMPGYQTIEGQPLILNSRTGKWEVRKTDVPIEKIPTETDITFERNYTAATALIDALEKKYKIVEKKMAKTWTERITKYPQIKAEILLQSDKDFTTTKSLTEATLSKLIRSLGEVGTLTDQDVDRARKSTPSPTDTIEVKDLKIQDLRDLTKEIFERGRRQRTVLSPPTQTTTSNSINDINNIPLNTRRSFSNGEIWENRNGTITRIK